MWNANVEFLLLPLKYMTNVADSKRLKCWRLRSSEAHRTKRSTTDSENQHSFIFYHALILWWLFIPATVFFSFSVSSSISLSESILTLHFICIDGTEFCIRVTHKGLQLYVLRFYFFFLFFVCFFYLFVGLCCFPGNFHWHLVRLFSCRKHRHHRVRI